MLTPIAAPPPKVVQQPVQDHARFNIMQAPPLLSPPKTRFDVFLKQVDTNQVVKATVRQDQKSLVANMSDGSRQTVVLPAGYDTMSVLLAHNIEVDVKDASISIFDVIFATFQLVILRMVFKGMSTRLSGMKMKPAEKPDVSFTNVAGIPNAKQDLMEIVDFLKNRDKYSAVGARVPRGVLLVGGPGVGKTLLAKAVAGEANVPFFSCSGSDFVEMFVGLGASRLRGLFQTAVKQSPCIIFIDEIDSIGRTRASSGVSGSSDEREQTLNQLLTLMDGFDEANNKVIVMGATNRVEVLDDALLRPGRFDRKIYVESPNIHAREDILRIHTAKMPLGSDVNLYDVSASTIGFSGADLQNLANEAAIQAVRNGATAVSKDHWEAALDKVILGDPKVLMMNDETRKKIAYHEAGHALVGILANDFDDLKKISIVPRGHAGGVTYFQPHYDVDTQYVTREYLENKIMVTLGGRIAEDLIFGSLKATTGASGDLLQVLDIAYDMVARYGFNDALGPAAWSSLNGSADLAINEEIHALVQKCYRRAKMMLRRNEKYLHLLAKGLLDKGTLSIDDVRGILRGISCCVYISRKRAARMRKRT